MVSPCVTFNNNPGSTKSYEFVREHARRRAEQRFPLEAVLHAYRCGHKVYSYWLRETVMSAVAQSDDPQQIVADVADYKAHGKQIGAAYREHFGRWSPAMSLLQIAGFYDDGALIERCLTRDPKARLRDIGEARIALENPNASSSGVSQSRCRVRSPPRCCCCATRSTGCLANVDCSQCSA